MVEISAKYNPPPPERQYDFRIQACFAFAHMPGVKNRQKFIFGRILLETAGVT